MTSLVGGMDLALCISNRLRAYFAYFQRLPPALTTSNLQKALVALYTQVLRFLAGAIRTYSKNTAVRKFEAVWRDSDLTAFESQCSELGGRADIEANNCDRELRGKEWTVAAGWKNDLDTTLRKLDSIEVVQRSLDALQVKVDLSKLFRVPEATYNSLAEEKLSHCLDGTRSEILHNITQWVQKPDGKPIFWLCGKAGTGKSTISRTVAQRFDKQQCLGASFFFKRGEKNRSNADHFFSAIAAQLADVLSPMQVPVAAALDKDSHLCGRGLQEQFEKLLLQPLLSMDPAPLLGQSVVIVIDALDECDEHNDIRMLLKLLAEVEAKSALRMRVFMTSRPELPIQLGFRQLDGSLHEDIVLEEVQEQTIQRDIRAYFDNEFAKIRADRLDDRLPEDWPSKADLQKLVDLAVPLFIFASTVCRFVSESKPQKRLKLILEQRYAAGSSHVAKTYLPILDQLLLEKSKSEQEEILEDFRTIVGPIILAADPLSVASLASLLGIEQKNINEEINILTRLHSVLYIPKKLDDPVRLLHLSFRDFLIDKDREDRGGFWIDEGKTHRSLAEYCLRRLNEHGVLKSDICDVTRPGTRRIERTPQQIATKIMPDVAYACSYWPWHIINSGEQLCDNSQVYHFLQQHFLHWLEALSWLSRLSSAVTYISELLSIAQVCCVEVCYMIG